MKKLDGKSKHNIAVFISGRGSNLRSIVKYSMKRNSYYIVKLVISNKQKAKGLKIAKKKKINNYFIYFTKSKKLGNRVLNILLNRLVERLLISTLHYYQVTKA